jgi:hypothetical protein
MVVGDREIDEGGGRRKEENNIGDNRISTKGNARTTLSKAMHIV